MTPEELAAYREWLRIMEFKDNEWPCMALIHIDQQAALIIELAKRNADLEARIGHEQVVTMQDRETQLQKHIQELEKKVEFWSGVAMKYAPDEEVMEG